MSTLYIANISLRHTRYMCDQDEKSSVVRLVWAASTAEARTLVLKEVEVDDPYGYGIHVDNIDISEAIGSP